MLVDGRSMVTIVSVGSVEALVLSSLRLVSSSSSSSCMMMMKFGLLRSLLIQFVKSRRVKVENFLENRFDIVVGDGATFVGEGALLLGNVRVLLNFLNVIRSWGGWQRKVGELRFLWGSISKGAMVDEWVSWSAIRDCTMAEGDKDIIDVVKGISWSTLGLLRADGRGSWSVGLHGQVLIFIVLELQDLFGWFHVCKFLSFGGR
jgi:hypothetical protein